MSEESLPEWYLWTLITALADGDDEAAAAMTTKARSTATLSPQPINFAEPEQSFRHSPADVLGCVPTAKGGSRCTRVLPLPCLSLVAAPKMSRVAAAAIVCSR